MGEFPSSLATTLSSFVVIGLAEEEIFCHVTSSDHVLNGLCGIMGGYLSS